MKAWLVELPANEVCDGLREQHGGDYKPLYLTETQSSVQGMPAGMRTWVLTPKAFDAIKFADKESAQKVCNRLKSKYAHYEGYAFEPREHMFTGKDNE